MSVINQLLPLSLNHLPWVIAGLLSWVFAYWQLYKMSDTFSWTLLRRPYLFSR